MSKQTVKRKKRIVRHAPSVQHKKLARIEKRSRVKRPATQEEQVQGVTAAAHEGLQPNITSQFVPSSEYVKADVVEVVEVEMTTGPEGREEIDETARAADLLLLDQD
jgi:hypothetical protein